MSVYLEIFYATAAAFVAIIPAVFAVWLVIYFVSKLMFKE